MKILIQYEYRLGDMIRMFPVARHYAAKGYEVVIECRHEYWGIFKAITYARPVPPGSANCLTGYHIFRPQIWPNRYDHFRRSGLPWMDYVYGLYPEWADIDRRIVFDRLGDFDRLALMAEYGLPEGYQMICPFNYSSAQVPIETVFRLAAERANMDERRALLFMAPDQKRQMVAQGFEADQIRCVEKLSDLPAIVAFADTILTVNTSTTIIASAVRDPDRAKARYFHIREPNLQDNHTAPNQTVLTP